jgi:aminotransferase EvaB
MKVSFVDLPRQIAPYHARMRAVFDDVVFRRADFIMRDDLITFEQQFAKLTGTAFAIGVANGSDALNLAVKALGIGPGDEVITVSHTFVATMAAVVHAGATPVLVDVGADHVMDPDAFAAAITPRTKAVIPVHLNGRMCDMGRIMKIASERGLHVIEDSAQAIGARFDGKQAGSYGALSTNSFYPFKIIGCFGDGGALTLSDPDLNYRLRCLRDNGQDRAKGEILFWGWNSRLDNLQAAVLSVLLEQLPAIVGRRRAIAAQYCDSLAGLDGLRTPPKPTEKGAYYDSFQNYVIESTRRDGLLKHLADRGVGTLISWPVPNHHHRGLGLDRFRLPKTERLSREVLSLPMHPALEDAEVAYVIDVVRQFHKA